MRIKQEMLDIDDIDDVNTYDQYVGAQVRVPVGDEIHSGKFVRRKRELDRNVKGLANTNSMLYNRPYEIEFPDGSSDEYSANVISDNMYTQCDEEGNKFNIMESIVDHTTDGHAMERGDMYIKHGSNKQVSNTIGWHVCVE
jgi:hypothetical protein